MRSTANRSSCTSGTCDCAPTSSTAVQTHAGRRPSSRFSAAQTVTVTTIASRNAGIPSSPSATAPTLAAPPITVATNRDTLFRRVATGSGWRTRIAEMIAHSAER